MLRTRRKTIFTVLVGLALIMWAVGGTLWYSNLYMNKERRFWAAIGNGLRTNSVVKEQIQDSPNGETTQLSRMSFGSNLYSAGKTKIYNRTSTTTNSTVITETLSTADKSYVRYNSIDTNEKREDGSDFKFDDVLGKWAVRSDEASTREQMKQQLAENFIQLVPFSQLSEKQASEFVAKLQATNAYTVDYNTVAEDSENKLTVYDVTVNAKPYVVALSDLFKQMGFGEVSALDASQYDDTSTIKIKVAIDGTNLVRKVAFSNEDFETYRDYGAVIAANIPQDPLSFTDLQTRLQNAR
ncbi:MAG: hypothetical protein M3Q70_01665 [bacterium]|nr:hypothetical protein [bacterium]